jgi:hypothetical protein
VTSTRAFGEPDCWLEVVYSQNDLKAIPFISYLAHQVVLDSSVGKGGGILKERCPREYTQKFEIDLSYVTISEAVKIKPK